MLVSGFGVKVSRDIAVIDRNEPQASVCYISRVFSNDWRVLSQCNTRLRRLHFALLPPQGFWPQRAKNPRRHLRTPRVIEE